MNIHRSHYWEACVCPILLSFEIVAWLCDVHKKCYSCPLSSIGCCKSAHPTNSDEVKADLKQIESVQEKWCFSSSCSCTFARLYDRPHSAPSRSPLPACPAPACSEPSILSVGVPLPYPGLVPLPYPGLESSETTWGPWTSRGPRSTSEAAQGSVRASTPKCSGPPPPPRHRGADRGQNKRGRRLLR